MELLVQMRQTSEPDIEIGQFFQLFVPLALFSPIVFARPLIARRNGLHCDPKLKSKLKFHGLLRNFREKSWLPTQFNGGSCSEHKRLFRDAANGPV